ncbi:MAG: ABC transporter ATP-binding protein [Nevskia sp.]|nr:ABC transporter ATP-binding protein [Nevskia sp.]
MSTRSPASEHSGSRSLLRIAAAIPLRRNIVVMLCLSFASIAEGIGVATLLPLIAVLGDDASKTNALSKAVLGALDRLHLPHDPAILLGIIAAGMLLKAGLMLLALRQVGHAVADVAAGMRLGLIEALLHARWSYYVRQPVGRFSGALGGEATRAGEAYNAMSLMFSLSVQALVYLLVAALASWKLALLAILVSLIMIGSLNRLLAVAKQNARVQSGRLQSLLVRLTDVLVGIKPMKAMARHARFNTLFQQDLKAIRKASRRQVFSKNANKALQEPILALCLSIGIFGALRVMELPIGEVLIMSLLLAKIVSIVGKAQQELQNVYAAESGFFLVRQAIEDTQLARENAHGGEAPTFTRELRFRDVSFAFDGHLILRNGSFMLKAGEVAALTGPSGAGKTTLVDLLLGLHQPDAGEILIDGVPLDQLDLMRWRSLTGYVPQELMLFNDSIATNVTLGAPEFSRDDVERALRQAGAWDFVARLPEGIDTSVGERGSMLSGGQRQRIAIARALVHQPRLLILDEATSALDPGTEAGIVDNVCALARSTGLSVLSISHHAAWVEVAERVIRLEGGILSESRVGV